MSDSKRGRPNSSGKHRVRRGAVAVLLAFACVAHAPTPLGAEEPAPPAAAPRFSMAQLVDLVGPIALYPDALLASILPATAYPLDVVAAARLVQQNGGKAVDPPAGSTWDDSVEALLQFPDVLLWLDQNLPWLEDMGLAIANQQGEVLEAIQQFRRQARDAGNLRSTPEQTVTTEPAPDRPDIANVIIQPARPEICYVPVYDPALVVRPALVTSAEPLIGFGLGFTFGALGSWLWHDIYWGWWDPWSYRYWGGIYLHDRPYYWSAPRSPGWRYGPHRPPLWHAPHRSGGGRHGGGTHGGGTHGGGMDGGGAPGSGMPGAGTAGRPMQDGRTGAPWTRTPGWNSRSSPTMRSSSSVNPPARTSRASQPSGRRTSLPSTPPTYGPTTRSGSGPMPTAPRTWGGASSTPRAYGPFGNPARPTGSAAGTSGRGATTSPAPASTINRWRDRGQRSLTPSSTPVPRTTSVPRAAPSSPSTVRRATPPTIAPTTRFGSSSRRAAPMWPTASGRAASNRGHQSLGGRSSAPPRSAPRSSRSGRR